MGAAETCELVAVPDRPECCPRCHEQRRLRRIIVEGEQRRVCCTVLDVLVTKHPESIRLVVGGG